MSYSVDGYIVKEFDKLNTLVEHGYAYKVTNGYAIVVKDLYDNFNKVYGDIGIILKSIGVDKYVEFEADYFGGCGEQHSIVHDLNNFSSVHENSINDGLREIGVVRTEELDEFDIVGLGSIRENDNVIPQEVWEQRKSKKIQENKIIEDEKYALWETNFIKLSEHQKLIEINNIISDYQKSKPKSFFSDNNVDDSSILDYNKYLSRYLESIKS